MRRIPVTLAALALTLVTWAPSAHSQCGITGSPVINGAPAELCGTGGTSYMWEGPNAFLATTQCVSITTPGEYSLLAFDSALGMWFGPCLVMVTGDSVVVPPPPPPPPAPVDTALNCPRVASFWMLSCRFADGEGAILSAQQVGAIAAAVDQRSQVFGWADASGFCATMQQPRRTDLRARALRQFAAVLANVAAGEQHFVTADGRDVVLRENTMLAMDAARGMSLREWIASTDAELMSLANASSSDRTARKAFQRIRRIAWMLNHGVGVGEVCPTVAQDGRVARADDESMASAFSEDDVASAVVMESASPNPFTDRTRIAYTLAQDGDVELSVLDLSGRLVKTLVRGAQAAGRHEMSWDGRTDAGQSLPAGAYFVHGRVGEQRVQGRIVMIR